MNGKFNRISHLDGMRGIAILLVVFFHAYARWPDYLGFVTETKDIFIFKYGYLGVQLFFMISGFVIFMSLDRSNSIMEFMKKRWLRLFPAMLIASVIIYSTANLFYERPAGIPEIKNLIPGLTFIHPALVSKILGDKVSGLEGAFWSLYVEMMFYVFSCFLYFMLGRGVVLKAIFIAFLVSYLGLVVDKIFGIEFFVTKLLGDYVGMKHYGWFFIGCFMYEKLNGKVSFLDKLLMMVVVIANLSFAYKDVFKLAFMTFIILAFFFSFYVESIKNFFNHKLLLFFGLISYPLYLIHENIMVSGSIKIINTNVVNPYLSPLIPILLVTLVSYMMVLIEPRLRSSIKMAINFT